MVNCYPMCTNGREKSPKPYVLFSCVSIHVNDIPNFVLATDFDLTRNLGIEVFVLSILSWIMLKYSFGYRSNIIMWA